MIVAFQEAFARVVADAALRRRFAVEPDAVLDHFELDERERAALRGVPFDLLERYARSLIAKRWDELSRVVPLVRRVVPQLEKLYIEWALEHPAMAIATVHAPGVAEALRAERAIFDELCDDYHAPYAAELWCFEIRRAASRRDGIVREQRARFDLVAIAGDIELGFVPIDPEPRAIELRFERDRVRTRPV